MRAIVTGGAGFLGRLVVRRLLDGGADEVLVVDAAPAPDLAAEPGVTVIAGDLLETVASLDAADVVVHLAAVVSGAAEADLDLGMRVNLDGTRAVLERCRAWGTAPVVVFASSLAVFGLEPGTAAVIDDDTVARPRSSYGSQKLLGEVLVAEYTRRGLVRGRTVRPMTVAVRPGRPNAAASGFVSGIIREPLAGERARCPVDPDTPLAISSPAHTVDGIMAAVTASDEAWGPPTAVSLPGITTTPRAMVAALERVAGPEVAARVDWARDPAVESIVASWPAVFRTDRAHGLGLRGPVSVDELIREHLASH